MTDPALAWRTVDSPVGPLLLTANTRALTGIHFETSRHARPALPPHSGDMNAVLDQAAIQLAEYFRGARRAFDVPLEPEGTEWQMRVWRALRVIPHGATRTYGDVARALGKPSASRAVGHANGLNPIPIIVACHRVIGASGALVGFGGGLPAKRWLLDHERPRELSLFDAHDAAISA